MLSADSVVAEFSVAAGSTASSASVSAAVESVTRGIAGFAVASIESGFFAIERAVAPPIADPGCPGTSPIAVDDFIVGAIVDGLVRTRCSAVLAALDAGAVPGCGATIIVSIADTVFAGTSVTSGCVEGCDTTRVYGIGVAVYSTVCFAEIDAGLVPDHIAAKGVDGTNTFFTLASITSRCVCGHTTWDTIGYGFSYAFSFGTHRVGGASVPIVAGCSLIQWRTGAGSVQGVAEVFRAGISIVAIRNSAWVFFAEPIIAGEGSVAEGFCLAAGIFVGANGTRRAAFDESRLTGNAGAIRACVARRAGFSIVAKGAIEVFAFIETSTYGIAEVDGAGIVVVAVERVGTDAFSCSASIVLGADVSVVAGVGIWCKHTACKGLTGVFCAVISIVACHVNFRREAFSFGVTASSATTAEVRFRTARGAFFRIVDDTKTFDAIACRDFAIGELFKFAVVRRHALGCGFLGGICIFWIFGCLCIASVFQVFTGIGPLGSRVVRFFRGVRSGDGVFAFARSRGPAIIGRAAKAEYQEGYH